MRGFPVSLGVLIVGALLTAREAAAEPQTPETLVADLWERCVAHVLEGAGQVIQRYSRDLSKTRRIAIESVTSNVFKRTGWAEIKEAK